MSLIFLLSEFKKANCIELAVRMRVKTRLKQRVCREWFGLIKSTYLIVFKALYLPDY